MDALTKKLLEGKPEIHVERTQSGWWCASAMVGNQRVKAMGDTKTGAKKALADRISKESLGEGQVDYRDLLLQKVEEGELDKDMVIMSLIKYISQDDVREVLLLLSLRPISLGE